MTTTIITQKNNKRNTFKEFSESIAEAHTLAYEIMQGTNEKAADILKVCGFGGLIDGTNYATREEAIKFYGVTGKYLTSVLTRLRINTEENPDDILRVDINTFLSEQNVRQRYYINGRSSEDKLSLYDKEMRRPKVLEFSHDKRRVPKGYFYSARLILALSALLPMGRSVPEGSTVLDVFERLCSTSYHESAVERAKQNSKKFDEQYKLMREAQRNEQQKNLASISVESISVSAGGEISIPIDELVQFFSSKKTEVR